MPNDALDDEALAELRRIGGDALAVAIAKLVLSVAPVRVETIASAVAICDWSDAFRAAHSLHPLAARVGARTLQRLAKEAEALASAQDEAGLRLLLPQLSRACAQACERLGDVTSARV